MCVKFLVEHVRIYTQYLIALVISQYLCMNKVKIYKNMAPNNFL